MAVDVLRRLAAKDPAPVHAVVGRDAAAAVDRLSLDPRVALTASPRHAAILLVAGELRPEDGDDLRRLHDQLPHPRATVVWRAAPHPALDAPTMAGPDDDVAATVATVYGDLLQATRASEADLQPDESPNPWRGRGDHGQGGEGMMGGTPYGRPMAMTDDDLRDGLQLDAYTAEFGPFLPVFPPGLKLRITLQGDVIQVAKVLRPPFPQDGLSGRAGGLRLIARQLRLLGLPAHAERALRAAARVERDEAADMGGLRRLVAWSGAGRAIPSGLGETAGGDVRTRLDAWWELAARGVPAPTVPPADRLVDLLPGLEWNEAMLVLNSFEPATLAAMSPVEQDEEDEGEQEGDAHGGHAHHHHAHGAA